MSLTQWLLAPAFIHVLLVLSLGARMGRARVMAVRSGKVKLRDIALSNSAWPDEVKKLSNNYQNQFETPVLFYAVLPLLLVTGLTDWVSVVLAWAYVATRIAHSVIHTGDNVVLQRFQMFLAGFAALALLWLWFGVRLFVIG
jgi:hypothetical protein